MKNSNRPEWVTKYSDIGVSTDWADPVLEKHSDDLISKLSGELCPTNYININLSEIDKEPLKDFPDPPEDHTFTESVLAVFDILSEFSKVIPNEDRKIHTIYDNMRKNDSFCVESKFPEFYRFCRDIQYNQIDKTNYYQILEETYNSYIDTDFPPTGTTWLVVNDEDKYHIKVQGKKSVISKDISKPMVYGQVVDVLSNNAEYEIGEFVTIPPSDFQSEI